MGLSDSALDLLNRSPAKVVEEQLAQLYQRLYPFMKDDFSHTKDLMVAFKAILSELVQIKAMLLNHTHPVAPGAPATGISIGVNPAVVSPVIPSPIVANALNIPAGVPQPTGEGIALTASRVPVAGVAIAIPPIDLSVL